MQSLCTSPHGSHVGVLDNTEKVFWEFGSTIMQNSSNVLLLVFCTSTWTSNHVSARQELAHICNSVRA